MVSEPLAGSSSAGIDLHGTERDEDCKSKGEGGGKGEGKGGGDSDFIS